jgi:hypothetical protein
MLFAAAMSVASLVLYAVLRRRMGPGVNGSA